MVMLILCCIFVKFCLQKLLCNYWSRFMFIFNHQYGRYIQQQQICTSLREHPWNDKSQSREKSQRNHFHHFFQDYGKSWIFLLKEWELSVWTSLSWRVHTRKGNFHIYRRSKLPAKSLVVYIIIYLFISLLVCRLLLSLLDPTASVDLLSCINIVSRPILNDFLHNFSWCALFWSQDDITRRRWRIEEDLTTAMHAEES